MRVIWAPVALDRAEEAARFIAADRPAAAAKWIDGLFDAVARLSAFPDKGRMVPEVGRADVREVLYGKYRVVYRLEEKRLFVLTVRHQRRDFSERILREEQ
jgi:toxin ParE1/3/4